MRLILSRKGFDSSYGGVASPIFPDGSMCSLPIPVKQDDGICFKDINFYQKEIIDHGSSIGDIVENLTKDAISKESYAHLDPDLSKASRRRTDECGWLPAFGQSGAAARHLKNMQVERGDLFLFFGWFREVECRNGKYAFKPGAPDRHVIFGWLQIDKIYDQDNYTNIPTWLGEHPHVTGKSAGEKFNTIYTASPNLTIEGLHNYPGGGAFKTYDDCRLLTRKDSHRRSDWKLPPWIKDCGLSYHSNENRWEINGNSAYLRTVPKGQEFVTDCGNSEEQAANWVNNLFKNSIA